MDNFQGKKRWRCVICGEIVESDEIPLVCPVCHAGRESFELYVEETVLAVSQTPFKAVIIGGGIAAFSAAQAIRERNPNATITILSEEPDFPYYRTSITKKLAMKANVSDALLKQPSWYAEHKIDICLNTTVTAVDTKNNTVTTENGAEFVYDKLLFATGAHPFIPEIPGIHEPGVLALRAFTDVDKLRQLLGETMKRVCIIGGGVLGLELAWSLITLGHSVTVVEMCPILLPRQMDPEGAPLLLKKVESKCTLKLGAEITAIRSALGKLEGVELKNDFIPADIVVCSVGVRSNVKLAQEAGLAVKRGICVNRAMQTSCDAVYAAGDCAECEGRFDGLWETASQQGKIAGAQMCGDTSLEFGIQAPSGTTFFAFGTSLFSIGTLEPNTSFEVVTARNEIKETYKKFIFVNRKLCGGVLLGDTAQTRLLVAGMSDHYDVEDAQNHDLI